MRPLSLTALLLAWVAMGAADGPLPTVSRQRIKVQLFASPSFVSVVSVDANNGICLSLDNNLIDGRVQSILVGGYDVATVYSRNDWWNCHFYDNYDCTDNSDNYLTIPDGVNDLVSIGWGSKIHGVLCRNTDPDT